MMSRPASFPVITPDVCRRYIEGGRRMGKSALVKQILEKARLLKLLKP